VRVLARWTVFGIIFMLTLMGTPASMNGASEEFFGKWELGDYWIYRGDVMVGAPAELTSSYTLSYYVVARVDLLYKTMYALAEVLIDPIGRETIGPLIVQALDLQPRPSRWPFLMERVPKGQAVAVLLPQDWFPEEGGWQRLETAYPGEEEALITRYTLQGEGPAEVSVPAGTFQVTTVSFQRQLEPLADEGTAWWSEQVKWWVRIEGMSRGQSSSCYVLELLEWGRLTQDELAARLLSALAATEEVMPQMAEQVRKQLEEVGITLEW